MRSLKRADIHMKGACFVKRLAGIDYGDSRIGVALCDSLRITASGKLYCSIGTKGLRHIVAEIGRITAENDVEALGN